jgi:hypothetical protein
MIIFLKLPAKEPLQRFFKLYMANADLGTGTQFGNFTLLSYLARVSL